jgi:hypothetical protein
LLESPKTEATQIPNEKASFATAESDAIHNDGTRENNTPSNLFKDGKVSIVQYKTSKQNLESSTLGKHLDVAYRTFPEKLMELLETEALKDVMWWLTDGEGFALAPQLFSSKVLSPYFYGTKFESFTRKLNRWYVSTPTSDDALLTFSNLKVCLSHWPFQRGFKRVAGQRVPPNAIAYHHVLFKKGRLDELKGIRSGRKSQAPAITRHGNSVYAEMRHNAQFAGVLPPVATIEAGLPVRLELPSNFFGVPCSNFLPHYSGATFSERQVMRLFRLQHIQEENTSSSDAQLQRSLDLRSFSSSTAIQQMLESQQSGRQAMERQLQIFEANEAGRQHAARQALFQRHAAEQDHLQHYHHQTQMQLQNLVNISSDARSLLLASLGYSASQHQNIAPDMRTLQGVGRDQTSFPLASLESLRETDPVLYQMIVLKEQEQLNQRLRRP